MEPIRLAVAKLALCYGGAAAATAIADMLHLMLGPSNLEFNVNQGILFIVGGIAQMFWNIPMIRRWGMPWYAIGIGGTAVFMALFFITRVPGNPITGRGGPVDNPVAITIEVMRAAFIGLAAAIMVHEGRKKKQMVELATGSRLVKNNVHAAITVGIAAALVLAGLFVLPMPMPRPAGGPPGPGELLSPDNPKSDLRHRLKPLQTKVAH